MLAVFGGEAWMKCTHYIPIMLIVISGAVDLMGQTEGSAANSNRETTLRVNSREVLVDVLVTDKKGEPVRGLAQSAFTVKEQGKPQTVTFFEEHQSADSNGIESLT